MSAISKQVVNGFMNTTSNSEWPVSGRPRDNRRATQLRHDIVTAIAMMLPHNYSCEFLIFIQCQPHTHVDALNTTVETRGWRLGRPPQYIDGYLPLLLL